MQPITRRQFALAALATGTSFGIATRSVLAERPHTLEFRLMAWQSKHCHETKEAESHYKALKSVGCQVEKDAHNGHIDVRYRLPFWKTIALKTDDEAHKWQKYLDNMGFETRHEH